MWSVYLKIAYRTLVINKFYTFVNVFGLSVGVACSLLIIMYLHNEFTYDTYLPDHERIYRISIDFKTANETRRMAAAHPAVANSLQEAFDNIEYVTKLLPTEGTILSYENTNLFCADIFFADSSFFKVFQYAPIAGTLDRALHEPNTLVITESYAKELFKDDNPIGKQVNIRSINLFRYDGTYTVKAVIPDAPDNTQLPFKALISWNEEDRFVQASWVYTYFLLDTENDIKQFKKYWKYFYNIYLADKQLTREFHLFNIADVHLRSNLMAELYTVGNVNYLYIFLIVAIFIIGVACMNYINMTAVRYAQRLKEVGVRKALGSDRTTLIRQFLVEAALLTSIAFLLALSLTEITLPVFNEITGKSLSLKILLKGEMLLLFIGLFLLIVFLAGGYPALYLANLKPITALQGRLKTRNRNSFRRLLVISQFMIAIITLVGTGVVSQQLSFLHSQDLGLQKTNMMVVRLSQSEVMAKQLTTLKQALLESEYFNKIGNSVDIPGGNIPLQFLEVETPDGKMRKEQLGRMIINDDFLKTLDIQLVKGRHFDSQQEDDFRSAIIINEAAAEYLSWEEPIGKKIIISRDATGAPLDERVVIGVVKNFHYSSLHTPIVPTMMVLSNRVGNLFLNIEGARTQEVIQHLEEVWIDTVPSEPLSFFLLDENFQDHYSAEEKLGELLGYFAGLNILISCLGLWGLASYTTEVRTKEIGIRKVLGASILNIIVLLSKDFLRLVLVASLLAIPLAYYFITNWLKNFAYKTEASWGIFLIAIVIVLLAALLPLTIQAVRVALRDPVKALRAE